MQKKHVLAVAALAALSVSTVAGAQVIQPDLFGLGQQHVYVMSNGIDGNAVAVLRRNRSGSLDKVGTYRTGGKGVGVGTTAPPPDPLGSQNALLLSDDGHLLFAVNAGSHQVSTFLVLGDYLELVDVTDSGGTYPVSIAQRGDRLFVLNSAEQANVTAFRIGLFGNLSKVPGGSRVIGTDEPLVNGQPNVGNTASQLQFDRTGRWLAVSVKDSRDRGYVETFGVDRSGNLAKDPAITPTDDAAAFGFTFDAQNHLLLADGALNAVSSFSIGPRGDLTAISSPVADGQKATCWLDANGHLVYTASAGTNTLSSYRVDGAGRLTLLDGAAADLGTGHATTDVKFSRDGKSLYVNAPGTGTVKAFQVHADGSLVPLGETQVFGAGTGTQGLAVQ
ncbi:lactonase family protein [Luteibacter aegosomatis]|uniref:lactonase family protein n=1 Tax=Luteibacter aegosomatis TaxID=2911537 RepID=UPI001FFB0CDE|nr:beta-propeller fold lactonase family protein [Luteibacter aegosomatis]UPG87413.1 lactonase family protein [Luteibacter aegosomatis]